MYREKLKQYIYDTFGVVPDCPWIDYPDYEVFRHKNNNKWFALVMNISKYKLDNQSEDIINIVNFKINPVMLGALLQETGIFPAYHMNKTNWITVCLDGTASFNTIKMLLQISYDLTEK